MKSKSEMKKTRSIQKKIKQEFRKGNHRSAINYTNGLIDKDPNNHILYFQLARNYYQLALQKFDIDYYKNAIDNYSKAIELAPRIAQYYAERAQCHLLQKSQRSQKAAFQDYSHAIEFAPNNADYQRALQNIPKSKPEPTKIVEHIAQQSTAPATSLPIDYNYSDYINVGPNFTQIQQKTESVATDNLKRIHNLYTVKPDTNNTTMQQEKRLPTSSADKSPLANTDTVNKIDNPAQASITAVSPRENKPHSILNTTDLCPLQERVVAKKQALQNLKNNYKKEQRRGFGWALTAAVSGIAMIAGIVTGALVAPLSFVAVAILAPICYLSIIQTLENHQKRQQLVNKIERKENELLGLERLKYKENQTTDNLGLNACVVEESHNWKQQVSVSSLARSLNLNSLLRRKMPTTSSKDGDIQKTGTYSEVVYSGQSSHP